MSSDPKRTATTRRAFLGWWLATLLTATVVTVAAPLGVYLFPARPKNQRKQTVRVELAAPVAELADGAVTRFDAPAGTAFTMADGGEGNRAGDPTFGGFLTRDQGKLRAFAITCPHLGCSYAFDDGKKHFVCPCHGSEFALDGSVIHGPASSPLSHLTWQTGPGTNEIEVDGLSIAS